MERYNIEYIITGREDGSWAVKAFDRAGKQLGNTVLVKTADEAWKVWMMLNGYHYADPFEIIYEKKVVA